MDKPKRVYVLEYDITYPSKEKEHKILYYSFEKRQEFIDRCVRLEDNYMCNINNMQTYYADLQNIDINKIINSI